MPAAGLSSVLQVRSLNPLLFLFFPPLLIFGVYFFDANLFVVVIDLDTKRIK